MKKKLSQAIAVATLVGAAGAANAMFVDGNGMGEVLLYPLYTADNGNQTYVSVTNTTDRFKAVKVRLMEHKNSQEVLDFNLYLSPEDKWSAAISLNAQGKPVINTHDTSCTAGRVTNTGIELRNLLYTGDSDASLDRAKIGHIELIEMGELDPAFVLENAGLPTQVTVQSAIEHVNGEPGNCAAVRRAFQAGGVWANNQAQGFKTTTADIAVGGLYGTGTVLNIDGAWQASYDAVALQDTYVKLAAVSTPRHATPGDTAPNFSNLTAEFNTFDGTTYTATNTNGVSAGYNAVSALLSKASIANDYVYGAGLGAQTDMVVTFPTKREYINNGYVVPNDPNSGLVPAIAPFTSPWNPRTSQACESVNVQYWDTEEATFRPEADDFSPMPDTPGFSLCYETNILHVGSNSNLFGGDEGHKALTLANGFEAGWLNFDFIGGGHDLQVDATNSIEGLPVIGFSAIAIVNGDVAGGVLANYASTYAHKATPGVPGVVTP